MEATKTANTGTPLDEIGAAVSEGEDLLHATAGEPNAKTRELRARLQAAIDKAKIACERLQEKTVAAAKATDTAVRQHPYEAMGVAFGVGLLVGMLVMRTRRD
jgi:ElaB/YqjD/DUF883 family membrane-anchored ribosome-binding protein